VEGTWKPAGLVLCGSFLQARQNGLPFSGVLTPEFLNLFFPQAAIEWSE
jgi:hypothetical protein